MLLERKRKVSTHPSIRIGEDTGVGCGELWKGDDGIVQLEEGGVDARWEFGFVSFRVE